MNRTLKFILLCGGIFICGVVVGGFGARRFWEPPRPPDSFGPRTMQKLTAELALTAEQRAIVEPLINHAADELRRLRRESWKQGSAVTERMNEGVLGALTPEQRIRFAELKAEQRARMQAAMEERQRRRSENDGPRRENGERPPRPSASPEDSR
jgi:Spy/CpxP family protein refolding chaperone